MRIVTHRWDVTVCTRFNRVTRHAVATRVFALASRLGDGVLWYAIMLALPAIYGWDGAALSLRLAATCAVGTLVYALIKRNTQRPRPCDVLRSLQRPVAPLDRFSFPSGHTLHAVSFTWMLVAAHPELGWALVPFALLVACSRLVLALHYPSDVLAGGALGAGLAVTSDLVAATWT